MAGLSLHTKLVLGPRRAHSLLIPGPTISCALGGFEPARGGREVWGRGAAVRHLLASPVTVPGVCFATVWRRLQVAHAVMWQERCQGLPALERGGAAGRAPGGAPHVPPAALEESRLSAPIVRPN